MKGVALLSLVATLIGAFAYTMVSVGRWEWNRAFFFGLVFVSAEVALATIWLATRVARLERSPDTEAMRAVLTHLEATRPSHHRFEWLRPDPSKLSVFITLLVGGGVVVSALAWLVDQVAVRTVTVAGERRLASELAAISYPPDGLVVDEVTALAHDLPYLDDPQLRRLLRQPGSPR